MKVIFLDIDGVLNSQEDFIENHIDKLIFYKAYPNEDYNFNTINIINSSVLDIDFKKLQLLKEIIRDTDCKIVISSSFRNKRKWPFIEEYLISKGLPIFDITPYINGNRGEEIRTYLKEHKEIERFIILDDDIFKDFYELEEYLIKTDFYNGGLTEEHTEEVIKILKK